MIYREEKRNLFSVPKDYILVHCISSDFALGAGIARKFREMGVADELERVHSDMKLHWSGWGFALWTNATDWRSEVNLVTKPRYFNKPTYKTLRDTLEELALCCTRFKESGIKLAMPKIGCGLDGLDWNKVKEMIKEIFANENVEILVCYF